MLILERKISINQQLVPKAYTKLRMTMETNITFATARNMIISNTYFLHKNIHKQTWISPCGLIRNQINHMLVDNQIKSCINVIKSMQGSSALSNLVKSKYQQNGGRRISTKKKSTRMY
jgi:hypothetical protein|uniref:Uncharacterized protein n=1 Tax=Sipha flava TaxID=143950 RepID=A0A2S2Q484_9HEMI